MTEQVPVVPATVLDSKAVIVELHRIAQTNGGDYIDAAIHYSEMSGADIETVASIVRSNPKIKFNMQESAEKLNFLPKTTKLPV
jgi:hypothetical protein